MDLKLNSNSIIGMACCGLYLLEENIRKFISKAKAYLESSTETEFPSFDSMVQYNILFDSVSYSIQIAQISSKSDYAVISGNTYAVVKVIQNGNNKIELMWNNDLYNVKMEKKSSAFVITLNHTDALQMEVIDSICPESSLITFPMISRSPPSELYCLLDQCLSELNNILSGYSLPEPFFTDNMYVQLEQIFTILRDPLLPSWQFQRYLDSVSTLLPASLVCDLQLIIGQYTSNFSSLFSRFPSNQIKQLIDGYLERICDNSTKLDMSVILRPTLELAEMYSNGTRGNAKDVIEKLLLDYLRIEIKFQDEETISNSSMICQPVTVSDLISHNHLVYKNKFLLTLFEFLEKYIPGIIQDLRGIIQRLLTSLTCSSYSLIISKLREILVTGQIPSYEIRKNEMESIFLSNINGYFIGTQTCRLENLICSNSEVFDIISEFFYHKIIDVRKCAMEVYVRRAYMAYDICSFEQSQLNGGQLCVLFKFSMPNNNNVGESSMGYGLKRSNSYVALMNNKTSISGKSSQIYRKQISCGYIEEDDLSDGELSNEEYYQLGLNRPKFNDYDTDSAISIGAGSLSELSANVSEQVDNDCILDMSKSRNSPSVLSLDRVSIPSDYSSLKDTGDNMKRSDLSLDKSLSYKHNRSMSVFCNNQCFASGEDRFSQYDLGVMIVFETVNEIEGNLAAIRELLCVRNSAMDDMDYLEYDMSTLDRDCSPIYKVVLKIILRDSQLINKCDTDTAIIFNNFCRKHFSFFDEICVIQITFLLQSADKTIRYFTFRKREQFKEDIKLRNIDPTLSFQLEINRLRNYHLERISVPNRRMYVYMGICKESVVSFSEGYRMFTRCIIYHKDFNLATSTIDFVAKEAERNLLEAMDAFDMAWIDDRANLTKANHLFFYFHSILCLNKIDELENVVRAIIFKHGRRLWSLRITQAELKMSVKIGSSSPIPIRLWVHNEGGKSLEVSIYREEFQFKTDRKVLITLLPNKDGRYHGAPVDCFYSV